MLSRSRIVLGIIVFGFLIIILLILIFTSRKSGSKPTCNCPQGFTCINGKCIPPSPCPGSPTVPSGQHCDASTLVCNPQTKKWQCNGVCTPPWTGSLCNCNCAPDEICVNGTCESVCGPPTIPDGQHCNLQDLVCDPKTKQWRCNGVCIPPWTGSLCNCNCQPNEQCTDGTCIPVIPCQGDKVVPSGQHCTIDDLVCDPDSKSWRCNGVCILPWSGELCNCNCTPDEDCVDGQCISKCGDRPTSPPDGEHCTTDNLICDTSTLQWRCNGVCIPPWSGELCKCNCDPDQVCINNICASACGDDPKIPDSEHCTQDFVCDPVTKTWHCNGVCTPPWEGVHCDCSIENDPTIVDTCGNPSQIRACQEDGTLITKNAQTCQDVGQYITATRSESLDAYCHNSCGGEDCGNWGDCICEMAGGVPQIKCQDKCPSTPTCPTCGPMESCICDERTNNEWACYEVFNPTQTKGNCPPKPRNSYCTNSSGQPQDLECVPCFNGTEEGYLLYCPGTETFPLECLGSKFHLLEEQLPNYGNPQQTTGVYYLQCEDPSQCETVYPTVNNNLCEKGMWPNNRLEGVDYMYPYVNNPAGNVLTDPATGNLSFKPADPSENFYYPNSEDSTDMCFWKPEERPTCSGRGTVIQQCKPSKDPDCNSHDLHDCLETDKMTDRCPSGRCECSEYQCPDGILRPYKGLNCEFDSINQCSNCRGQVQDDGSCVCSTYTSCLDGKVKPYRGNQCQYDDSHCQCLGEVQDDGSCICSGLYCSLNGVCAGPIVKNISIQGDGASISPAFDPNITNYTLSLSRSGSVVCSLEALFTTAPNVPYPSTTCPTSSAVCGGCVHVYCANSGNGSQIDMDAFNWIYSNGVGPETIDPKISILWTSPGAFLSYTFTQGSIKVTYNFTVKYVN